MTWTDVIVVKIVDFSMQMKKKISALFGFVFRGNG